MLLPVHCSLGSARCPTEGDILAKSCATTGKSGGAKKSFFQLSKQQAPPPPPPRLRPHRTLTWRVRQIKPLGEARTATVGEDESASARRRGKTPDSPRLEELPRRAGSGRAPAHPRLWRVRSAAAPASTAPQRQAELGTVRGVRGPRLLHQSPPRSHSAR